MNRDLDASIAVKYINVPEIFGENVFSDSVMRQRLPENVYISLKNTIDTMGDLDPEIANCIAGAMRDWALEKGATHFTHWFQPMTGVTAEKHDSFLTITKDKRALMELSGKELIKGETDASSFPSGGLRTTFEARGYTAWDCTSPAFVKDGSLYIPTVFCSYTGEALDEKTPLLRSEAAINKHALRLLRHFSDNDTARVSSEVGPEQEYFLIDREYYNKRTDLMVCGRTLFGKNPVKLQELDDHYYARLKLRVSAFMRDLDEELWKLGITAKTKHHEAAPAQHELATIYTSTNIACDHNQLTMEIMKKVAKVHGFACLLHEKPFSGVNGSGKHINWSLSTDTGKNLFNPGTTPQENTLFLLLVTAVIKAIDENAGFLRCSMATSSNDCRLGASEAPPAILSVYLGSELEDILFSMIEKRDDSILPDSDSDMLHIPFIPNFKRDTTDRNRTSPVAFTGNKFEFRMCGSLSSIARPCAAINAIIANEFDNIATLLDGVLPNQKEATVKKYIYDSLRAHKRIIYSGNNYADEWKAEAHRRGLPNYPDTVSAIPSFSEEKTVSMLERMHILNRIECDSRVETMYENYAKSVNIEAQLMIEMASRQIIPSALSYVASLASAAKDLNAIVLDSSPFVEEITKITPLVKEAKMQIELLQKEHDQSGRIEKIADRAAFFRDSVLTTMAKLREACDKLEALIPQDRYSLPSYFDMMYRV
ncbi:MAG: glutamine synthetase III [Clostridia bacterium]|nr:glutamine synthetase III [Clostridia bacterium]